jgi:hypothetical protein
VISNITTTICFYIGSLQFFQLSIPASIFSHVRFSLMYTHEGVLRKEGGWGCNMLFGRQVTVFIRCQ